MKTIGKSVAGLNNPVVGIAYLIASRRLHRLTRLIGMLTVEWLQYGLTRSRAALSTSAITAEYLSVMSTQSFVNSS